MSLIIDQFDTSGFMIGYPTAAPYLHVCVCVSVYNSKTRQTAVKPPWPSNLHVCVCVCTKKKQ